MDPAKKSTSETDEKFKSMPEKLEEIMRKFNEEYDNWVTSKEKESSSKHGNNGRPKANCVETEPELPDHKRPKANCVDHKRPKANCVDHKRPKANCVETEPKLPDHKIHGFVNEILFLKNYLVKQNQSKEFKTLAIVGKYGVGKTTLCQSVFNDAEVTRAYLPRIWVSMYSKETEDPKIDVVKRILRSLGVEDEMLEHIKTEAEEDKRSKDEAGEKKEETELSRLLNALHLNLIGKKYLIVLDDVWKDNKWNQRLDGEKNQQHKSHLSCGFPKEFGGRVIVTTRDESCAKEIVGEEENLQRLFPRSDAESIWNIYQDAVAPKVNPRYPKRFKQELMDKSCGVPLAARMLAKIEPVEMKDNEANMDRKKSF